MRTNERQIKPLTPKQSIILIFILMLLSVLFYCCFSMGDAVFKMFESDLVDKECTAVDIYTVVEVRRENMYTIFRDDSGNEYKKRTTMKDHLGRKAVLSTHGASAYRNSFELMKPSDLPTWTFFLMPLFFFISLIYYIVKAFRFGLDGSRAPAN